jgi:hypothetical protein
MIKSVGSKGFSGPAIAGAKPGAYQWSGVDSFNSAQGQIGAAKYGAQGQIGAAKYGAQGQIGAAKYGAQGMADQAKYNAEGQAQAAAAQAAGLTNQAMYDNDARKQASQDQRQLGMANAYGGLGAAGMNAVGQYGANVAGALANANVAAGNTFGSMANNYYNTLGQMGHIGGALSAAGLAASSNAANASMLGNMGMGGGFNFGGGGGFGGFDVSGPAGGVASGTMGGGGGGFGAGMNTDGSWNTQVQRGGGEAERQRMLNQGFGFLGGAMKTLNDPRNPAGALAGLADNQFNANRAALMDPRFLNTMTGMFRDSNAGIDSQSGMNRRSSALGSQSVWGQPSQWGSYNTSMDANPFYNYAQTRGASNARKFGL